MNVNRQALNFVRAVMATSAYEGRTDALAFAQRTWGASSPEARIIERTFVDTADLADTEAASRGFLELVQERSVIGKVTGWRRQPMNLSILAQTVTPQASWTQQGGAKPVTSADFARHVLAPRKVTGTLIVTKEAMTAFGTVGEQALARSLADAVAAVETGSLLDPANAGVPNITPASLTNTVAPIASTGTPAGDLKALVEAFGPGLDNAWLIMDPATAIAFHAAGFEGAGARGGEVAGIPLATSSAVPSDTGGRMIVLVDSSRVLLAEDLIRMDRSSVSSVQIGGNVISLWQENLTALLAEREISWEALDGSVAWVDGVTY